MANRAAAIYDFICWYCLQHNYMPTLDEIAAALGCSRSTAYENAQRLVELAVLDRPQRNRPRGLVVVEGTP